MLIKPFILQSKNWLKSLKIKQILRYLWQQFIILFMHLSRRAILKEIPLNASQSYYDTNVTHHHHFFDEEENRLIDIHQDDVDEVNIKRTIPGKK